MTLGGVFWILGLGVSTGKESPRILGRIPGFRDLVLDLSQPGLEDSRQGVYHR